MAVLRLLFDEMVVDWWRGAIAQQGHDIVTVHQVGLAGRSDSELLEFGSSDGRAILTSNIRDFSRIDNEWAKAGRSHGGLIFYSALHFNKSQGEFPGAFRRATNGLDQITLSEHRVMWVSAAMGG